MTAEPSADSCLATGPGAFDRPMAEFWRWSAGALVGLLWCAALLIGWRRLAGMLSRPLDPPVLLSVGGLVVIAAAGVRWMRRRLPGESETSRPVRWGIFLPYRWGARRARLWASGAVLCLGAALSLQGTETWGLATFWAMLLVEELWAWRPAAGRSPAGRRKAWPLPPGTGVRECRPATAVTDEAPGDDVLQQLTRSQAADGSEQLSGWLRAPFGADQRTATVHLAFCPQFAKTPEFTVEQLDGPELLRINKAVFSFGARLDLKLAVPAAGPRGVLLQFSARSRSPAPPATASDSTL